MRGNTDVFMTYGTRVPWAYVYRLMHVRTPRSHIRETVCCSSAGHVTEEMQRHYSTVGLDEKRAAIRGVLRLVPPAPTTEPASTTGSGVSGGVSEVVLKIAS